MNCYLFLLSVFFRTIFFVRAVYNITAIKLYFDFFYQKYEVINYHTKPQTIKRWFFAINC